MYGLKCVSMLLVIHTVTIDRQTVATMPVPHIIDAPSAHISFDIPAAIEGKAMALLDEEGQQGTFDLASHITDEDGNIAFKFPFGSGKSCTQTETPASPQAKAP